MYEHNTWVIKTAHCKILNLAKFLLRLFKNNSERENERTASVRRPHTINPRKEGKGIKVEGLGEIKNENIFFISIGRIVT